MWIFYINQFQEEISINLTKKLIKELKRKINHGCENPMATIYYFLYNKENKEELEKEIKDCEYCQYAIYNLVKFLEEIIKSDVMEDYDSVLMKVIESNEKYLDEGMRKRWIKEK